MLRDFKIYFIVTLLITLGLFVLKISSVLNFPWWALGVPFAVYLSVVGTIIVSFIIVGAILLGKAWSKLKWLFKKNK